MKNPIWTIKHREGTCYEITNLKTGKMYSLLDVEFVYGQIRYDEIVEKFPNYIHNQLWELVEKTNQKLRGKNEH